MKLDDELLCSQISELRCILHDLLSEDALNQDHDKIVETSHRLDKLIAEYMLLYMDKYKPR